jgi:hypothetical protein
MRAGAVSAIPRRVVFIRPVATGRFTEARHVGGPDVEYDVVRIRA